jgi:5-methyltetrahydropteroyltriglutamate--homocysteine methyltransferase
MRISTKILPTTVVGSYPPVKKGGFLGLKDPYQSALRIAVEDQVSAGIDIISDGQVRGDMISIFTSRIPGIKGNRVIGRVSPPQKPVSAGDVRYALSRHPKVKGIITGPSTIAYGLKIDTPVYRDRNELIPDIAQALAMEARSLEKEGVTMIQIDEPIFSTGAVDLAVGRQAINTIISVTDIPTCLHSCGSIGNIIDELLRINVSVLDFEFANNPSNLEVISDRDLKNRMIGYGCVDSTDTSVDSVDVIEARIRKGIEIFGAEKMLVDPDCGLRMHTRETAFGKLSNLVQAAGRMRAEY